MKTITLEQLPTTFFQYQEDETLAGISDIIRDVKVRGDEALRKYTEKFDGVKLDKFRVEPEEIQQAMSTIATETMAALRAAAENIRKFAELQRAQLQDFETELNPGVFTGQRVLPLARVGVYVPGGNFPLISTLLMGAIPAKVAGVPEICVVSPPTYNGTIHPAILAAAKVAGITEIYRVGGAQAIAALTYGTASIRPVDKIVGPGNKFVAQAKREVFGAVSIDMIAGPTEIMIIADDSADAEILAADLLAQAEHDVEARPVLVTTSAALGEAVQQAVYRQLQTLSTRATAAESIKRNGLIILVKNLDEAAEVANRKAPEHLEIQVQNAALFSEKLVNYGSLFIGENSAEVLGDYAAGINHTLPTNTTARYRGGLSVHDFLKIHTTLRVLNDGITGIGSIAKTLAEAEGLAGHANSIDVRLKHE
jgi:histidinol dehydrogenase